MNKKIELDQDIIDYLNTKKDTGEFTLDDEEITPPKEESILDLPLPANQILDENAAKDLQDFLSANDIKGQLDPEGRELIAADQDAKARENMYPANSELFDNLTQGMSADESIPANLWQGAKNLGSEFVDRVGAGIDNVGDVNLDTPLLLGTPENPGVAAQYLEGYFKGPQQPLDQQSSRMIGEQLNPNNNEESVILQNMTPEPPKLPTEEDKAAFALNQQNQRNKEIANRQQSIIKRQTADQLKQDNDMLEMQALGSEWEQEFNRARKMENEALKQANSPVKRGSIFGETILQNIGNVIAMAFAGYGQALTAAAGKDPGENQVVKMLQKFADDEYNARLKDREYMQDQANRYGNVAMAAMKNKLDINSDMRKLAMDKAKFAVDKAQAEAVIRHYDTQDQKLRTEMANMGIDMKKKQGMFNNMGDKMKQIYMMPQNFQGPALKELEAYQEYQNNSQYTNKLYNDFSNISLVEGSIPFTKNKAAADDIVKSIVLANVKALGSQPSEQDRKFMEDMAPSLSDTKEQIFEKQKRANERIKAKRGGFPVLQEFGIIQEYNKGSYKLGQGN